MLLEEIKNNNLTSYHESFDSWEDAIKACGKTMIKEGYIDDDYVKAIIDCVKEYGPYIVLMPGIAMPHFTLGAKGVYKNGIGFMKVKKPVSFDPNDEEKNANLFFTLAATNHDEHLKNMVQLSEMLMNEELVEELLKVENDDDLDCIIGKYR